MPAKTISLLAATTLLFSACSDSGSDAETQPGSQARSANVPTDPAKAKADAMAALNAAHDAYAKRDINALMAHFSPESDVVMIGTGADERRVGLAEIKSQAERDWAQTEASSITLGWNSISTSTDGSAAWVAADATFNLKMGGQEMTMPGRLTAVLKNHDGKWLIAQAHYSMPLAGQAEGESFPGAKQ